MPALYNKDIKLEIWILYCNFFNDITTCLWNGLLRNTLYDIFYVIFYGKMFLQLIYVFSSSHLYLIDFQMVTGVYIWVIYFEIDQLQVKWKSDQIYLTRSGQKSWITEIDKLTLLSQYAWTTLLFLFMTVMIIGQNIQ